MMFLDSRIITLRKDIILLNIKPILTDFRLSMEHSLIDFQLRDMLREECRIQKIKIKNRNIIVDMIIFAANNNKSRSLECLKLTKKFLDISKRSKLYGQGQFLFQYWRHWHSAF